MSKQDRKNFIGELVDRGLSYKKIGKMLGISRQRVHQIYRDYSSTPPAPVTYEPKPSNRKIDTTGLSGFSGRDYVREAVRKRDGYACQICFKGWESGQRRFDVHHLNGLCGKKSLGYDRIKDHLGLITLCHKCHLRLHNIREKLTK